MSGRQLEHRRTLGLQADEQYTSKVLELNYKALASKFHPDRVQDPEKKERYTSTFQAIGIAYDELKPYALDAAGATNGRALEYGNIEGGGAVVRRTSSPAPRSSRPSSPGPGHGDRYRSKTIQPRLPVIPNGQLAPRRPMTPPPPSYEAEPYSPRSGYTVEEPEKYDEPWQPPLRRSGSRSQRHDEGQYGSPAPPSPRRDYPRAPSGTYGNGQAPRQYARANMDDYLDKILPRSDPLRGGGMANIQHPPDYNWGRHFDGKLSPLGAGQGQSFNASLKEGSKHRNGDYDILERSMNTQQHPDGSITWSESSLHVSYTSGIPRDRPAPRSSLPPRSQTTVPGGYSSRPRASTYADRSPYPPHSSPLSPPRRPQQSEDLSYYNQSPRRAPLGYKDDKPRIDYFSQRPSSPSPSYRALPPTEGTPRARTSSIGMRAAPARIESGGRTSPSPWASSGRAIEAPPAGHALARRGSFAGY